MAEYIEREAIGKAYMDLCRAKSRLEKARRGAAFFDGDLLPDVEPTVKELFGLVMSAPATDVAPVVRCKDCRWFHDAHSEKGEMKMDGIRNCFTFAEKRKIQKVLSVIEQLSENDPFFAVAKNEFGSATKAQKVDMCKYMLSIFDDHKNAGCMTLEQAVILSAYPA